MTAEGMLASWRDTPTRQAIVSFVQSVASEGPERVAVFDNDGTLWSEKPVPVELDFTLSRMAELAGRDPSLRTRQPWLAVFAPHTHRPSRQEWS